MNHTRRKNHGFCGTPSPPGLTASTNHVMSMRITPSTSNLHEYANEMVAILQNLLSLWRDISSRKPKIKLPSFSKLNNLFYSTIEIYKNNLSQYPTASMMSKCPNVSCSSGVTLSNTFDQCRPSPAVGSISYKHSHFQPPSSLTFYLYFVFLIFITVTISTMRQKRRMCF